MTYDVTIRRKDISALFDLKGNADDIAGWAGAALPPLPGAPNTLTRSGNRSLLWIGPDHWLLRGALEDEAELNEALRVEAAPDEISIVLVSDTLAFFDIAGPDAGNVMAVATPLDLHASAFPRDGATFTEAFGLKALVLRSSDGFELAVERSYADMTTDYLGRITA